MEQNARTLANFDLNLLVALDALLRERSVTGAAARVGVGQSAMSGMLSRLRDQLGDPLLVRVGKGLAPTPRAAELEPEVRQIVLRVERLIASEREFDLATARRRIRIMASEHSTMLILPHLFARAAREAPGLTFDVLAIDAPGLRTATDDVDLCLVGGPIDDMGKAASDVVRTQKILQDSFVAIADRNHPAPLGAITLEVLRAYPHVVTQFPGVSRSVEEIILVDQGNQTPIAMRVPGFVAMGPAVRGSDRIGIIPSMLGELMTRAWDLRVMRLPVEIQPATVRLLWHERYDADPIHKWLRSAVHDSCAVLGAGEERKARGSAPGPR